MANKSTRTNLFENFFQLFLGCGLILIHRLDSIDRYFMALSINPMMEDSNELCIDFFDWPQIVTDP